MAGREVMKHIAVVVPTLYNKEGGYEALQSIISPLGMTWMPIIMDNWRTGRSVSQAWNFGIEQAIQYQPDYILVINDDVLFSPWTLAGLVNAFESPTIPSNTVMVTGQNLRGQIEKPTDIFDIEIPSHEEHGFELHPDFSCFMITPKTFSRIGEFDENFLKAYFEDNDYHRRIVLSGFLAISTTWAPYYHYGSKTQNYDDVISTVSPDDFIANREYYQGKWGGLPGEEGFLHPYGDPTNSINNWRK